MEIRKIQKRVSPLGFLNIVDAIKILGATKFGKEWLKKPYVKALPYRIGPINEKRKRRELLQRTWEPEGDAYVRYEESWPLAAKEFHEARAVRKQFLELANALLAAVQSKLLALRLRSTDGDRLLSKAPPGIVEAQWVAILETGQIRVRVTDQPDQLWTVYFEERKVRQLSKGEILRSSKNNGMTEEACTIRAQEIMLEAKKRSDLHGVKLDRDNYETLVSRTLAMENGAMTDDLFETMIWKGKWRESVGIHTLRGKQRRLRKVTADAFIDNLLAERRKSRSKPATV